MYECPHCNKPGISVWRKACLGPALPATCKQCGKKVGVPYSAMFVLAPLIIVMALPGLLDSAMLKIAIWVVAFLILEVIYLKRVPLVPR